MAKTKYQETAVKYAEDYLERVLKMEDIVGHNVENKMKKMAEREGKPNNKK